MKTVMIQGMSCQHCVAHVKKALEALPGVESVEVSLEDRAARVQGSADNETLIKAVAEAMTETAGTMVEMADILAEPVKEMVEGDPDRDGNHSERGRKE